MSASTPEEVHKSVRKYLMVFGALMVGTVVTVAAYYIHLPTVALTVAVALFIASVKAFLVAGYFMHLISEKKMIYGILASTVFFVIGLMFLTIWSMHDFPFSMGPSVTGAMQ
jgi:cytochrome c oxidase subunit 4